jgi:hypothetical protein
VLDWVLGSERVHGHAGWGLAIKRERVPWMLLHLSTPSLARFASKSSRRAEVVVPQRQISFAAYHAKIRLKVRSFRMV